MNKLKAILVDDEQSARDVLENLLIRFCPEVELLYKSENIPDAVQKINELKPDVVFLDIEMPNYAGYEIVNFFEEVNFKIIFITAYDNYAVRAFEVAALDYLLKPIDIERLKKSIARLQENSSNHGQKDQLSLLSETMQSEMVKNIAVVDHGQQVIVPVDKIIAIEAQESYSTIHLEKKKFLVSKNLKHFEKILDHNNTFIRTHKSWIINRSFLLHYSKTALTIQLTDDIVAKLSKYKKAEFEHLIVS